MNYFLSAFGDAQFINMYKMTEKVSIAVILKLDSLPFQALFEIFANPNIYSSVGYPVTQFVSF